MYAFQQHQIREEVKRQLVLNIPDSSFELIIAEQNDSFRWEEEGKEFYQDGQLYDVAKSVKKDGKTRLAHTLNGSALALPRIVASLLENNQTPEGIIMPKVLHSYLGFEVID